MLVDNAGGKAFEPDALLDLDREYEARVAGIVHIGLHEKQKHDGTKFIEEYDEIEQAIVWIELTEEDTFVERGAEGNKTMQPRTFPKFIKYSSHEKSGLFELAKTANPASAWIEKKKGKVQTGMFITHAISITLKNNKDGDKQNIAKITSIPTKYKSGVGELQTKPFQYSVMGGAFPLDDGTVTSIEDVPAWMLKFAVDKALNAEEFGQIEAIEAHLEAVEAAKDGTTELEGDRLKTEDKKSEKKPAKKAEKKVEEKVEETKPEPEDKVEEAEPEAKEKPQRRSRRTAKPKEDEVDYSGLGLNELEDLFMEKGGADEVLDVISAEAGEDDAKFCELVIAAIKAL